MKISYNTLKRYIPDLDTPENVAEKLVMHTAEVEEIVSKKALFNHIVYGKITKIEAHPDANSLRVCMVDAGENDDLQIVCGGLNLEVGQAVAVAKIGASVFWHGEPEPVIMKKTAIRGVDSYGMICASEEIGLAKDFPAGDSKEILDFGNLEAKTGTNLAELLKKDDVILEIDNKAINHRPDLFSHIGIAREVSTIYGKKLDYFYKNKDFLDLRSLEIKNEILDFVSRYMALKIENVSNIESPDYIKEVLNASGVDSKGLLIDLSNYSLYMYGQPTHIFDADKVEGKIVIRFAISGEKVIALNDKEYELCEKDIVIADDKNILAIAGIIGAKNSRVSENTKNIIIESANFDQAILRASGKKLGVRTDSLNVFEKEILPETANFGLSLIVSELEKYFPDMELISFSDSYPKKQKEAIIDFDLNFINNLIGKRYSEDEVLKILSNLEIKLENNKLFIPVWRKDLNYKADIAEEIARIDGYYKIETTIPEIQLGAVIQDNIYKITRQARNLFIDLGYFDMYTYSFVNEALMNKCLSNTEKLIPLKNSLSEEATHMKSSLIPNLLLSIEKNYRDFENLKLVEIEKVFNLKGINIEENYNISGVLNSKKDIIYYDIIDEVSAFLENVGINKFFFQKTDDAPDFAHKGRTAKLIIRAEEVGFIGEIHPKVAKNFGTKDRLGFFEINLDKIANMAYSTTKYKELSNFQASNFDISFVIDKSISGNDIKILIEKISPLVERVELFDIYENEEKLSGKKSLSFKVYLQKMTGEISDIEKNELIKEIFAKAEKKGAFSR